MSDAPGSGNWMVDQTLRVSTGSGFVVAPKRFTDAGMPVYDLTTLALAVEPKTIGGPLLSRDGWLISVGLLIRGARSGFPAWTWPQTHAGIQGSQPAGPPEYPGHVIGTTHLAGFTVTPKSGDAGEVWTVIGNLFMFTTDDLFVTELFRDRIAAGHGSGPDPVVGPTDAKRGLSLKDMSLGEEAFWPSITQTKDGEIYLVAGHGFSAICRVTGLETVKRLPPQTIELTPALVETARQQRVRKQQAEIAAAGPKSLTIALYRAVVAVDGKADDWSKAAFAPIADGLKGALQVSGDRLHGIVIASGNARYADYLTNVTAVDKLLFKFPNLPVQSQRDLYRRFSNEKHMHHTFHSCDVDRAGDHRHGR